MARILTDLRLDKTELGVIALSCAAAVDVTAWCLLAFVACYDRAHGPDYYDRNHSRFANAVARMRFTSD